MRGRAMFQSQSSEHALDDCPDVVVAEQARAVSEFVEHRVRDELVLGILEDEPDT